MPRRPPKAAKTVAQIIAEMPPDQAARIEAVLRAIRDGWATIDSKQEPPCYTAPVDVTTRDP